MPGTRMRVVAGVLLAGGLLLPCLGCCCWTGHGLFVRGGLSLEVNRVPWRTAAPDQGCGPAKECSACAEGGAAGCGRGCSRCRHGGKLAGLLRGGPPSPPREPESPFPRFHPVPKRPVFSPSCDVPTPAGALPAPSGPAQAPDTASPPEPIPAPLPELSPSSPPKSGDGWRPAAPKPAQKLSGTPGWIFRPVSTPSELTKSPSSQPAKIPAPVDARLQQPQDVR